MTRATYIGHCVLRGHDAEVYGVPVDGLPATHTDPAVPDHYEDVYVVVNGERIDAEQLDDDEQALVEWACQDGSHFAGRYV